MRCDQFERLLHAWMDGVLSPEEAMEVRAHADACPLCAELAGALRDALAACRDMDDEAEVPQAAALSWRRAVRVEAAKTKERRGLFAIPRWRGVASLAAGILVLIGGANLVRLGRMSLQPIAPDESPDFAEPAPAEVALVPQADSFEEAPDMPDALPPAPYAASYSAEVDLAEPAAEISSDADVARLADAGGMGSEAFGGAMGTGAAEPEPADAAFEAEYEAGFEEDFELDEAPLETQVKTAESTEEETTNAEAEPVAPVDRYEPLAFLLDACVFLALCLPPAAIAFFIVRLCKREKKAPNQPEP